MLTTDTPESLAPCQPVARLDHLVMSHVGEEVLGYDRTIYAIHRLNATSHLVWGLCDGTRTVAAIRQVAADRLGTVGRAWLTNCLILMSASMASAM